MNHRAFTYLAALLLAAAFITGAAAPSFAGDPVRIIRDGYGVPHIYAKNVFDLYFGYGYATADDRLFQIEMLRRSVQGRVSEVLGAKFIELDKVALRDGYSAAEIAERVEKLPAEHRRILEEFAAGINKRIAEVERTRGAMPREFAEMRFRPQKWSAADVASIFAGTMAVRYSDFTAEMDNRNLMNALVAKHGEKNAALIFGDVVPLDDPLSYPTLSNNASAAHEKDGACPDMKGCLSPAGNGAFPAPGDGGEYRAERARVKALLRGMGLSHKTGSYYFAVAPKRSKNGTTILSNGPQMGYFNPAYLFEAGLHCPGYDVVGTTTPCYMNMMFGMNPSLSFGATAGVGNLTDVYEEKLDPKDHGRYLFNGSYREFEKRVFAVKVRGRKKPVRFEFLRSVHGPVFSVDEKAHAAFAKRRAWEGMEVSSMFAWMEAVSKRNFAEMKKALAGNATSINIFAADRRGGLFYYLCGRYPHRRPGLDDRLPLPGDGSAEWLGFLDPMDNPSGGNEAQGYMLNWNSKPRAGFRNGDMATGWGADQRTVMIRDIIESRGKIDLADAADINREIGRTDVRAAVYLPALMKHLAIAKEAGAGGSTVETAIRSFEKWRRDRYDSDRDGRYDSPAVAMFDALWPELMASFFGPSLGELSGMIYSDPTWTQSGPLFRLLTGEAGRNGLGYDYAAGRNVSVAVADAVRAAFAKLELEYGTRDASRWLKKTDMIAFDTNNFTQVPQASAKDRIEIPAINRGTEDHIVELGEGVTAAFNVNPPGQSGYNPVDESLANGFRRDQLALYDGYRGYKPMHDSIADVISNKSSEKFIFRDEK